MYFFVGLHPTLCLQRSEEFHPPGWHLWARPAERQDEEQDAFPVSWKADTSSGLRSAVHDSRLQTGYPLLPLPPLSRKVDSGWVYSNFIVTEKPGGSKST